MTSIFNLYKPSSRDFSCNMIGHVTIATPPPPALAQNMTMGAENMTAGNLTGAGDNMTK